MSFIAHRRPSRQISLKDTSQRLAEVTEAYQKLDELGIIGDDPGVLQFKQACCSFVRDGRAAADTVLIESIGRKLRYALRPNFIEGPSVVVLCKAITRSTKPRLETAPRK
jgi:hypothetical protein